MLVSKREIAELTVQSSGKILEAGLRARLSATRREVKERAHGRQVYTVLLRGGRLRRRCARCCAPRAMWRAPNSDSGDVSPSSTRSMVDEAQEADREAVESPNAACWASIWTSGGALNSV